MKAKMRNKMVSAALSMMMVLTPVGGSVFAATDIAADQPERPVAESYEDNSKIEDYNRKVDEYNKAAKEHNEAVDKEYEAAVAETSAKNAEIEQHNAAETERVAAAEQRNAEAVQAAEEANAKIDEENAAEEARVNEHNSSEDAKVQASEAAKREAEEANEQIRLHNESVDRYEAEKPQYEADKAQYEKDLAMEQKILAAGYKSVEDYNSRINKAYNEPAYKSVEENAKTTLDDVSKTYSIREADNKSGVSVKVNVKHVFEGTDISYSDSFVIDANDIITLNSIGALGSATNPGYATFYFGTDADHSMGYWCESWSCLETTARHSEYGWNCGDEHEVSYKDGKSHLNDEEIIDMTYYYMWMPLKAYKTYNTPNAPTELVNPGERKELVEVPEIYTANYQTFEAKQHVEAELEDISAANILEMIEAPVRRAYMELLSYMDLFDEPEAVIPAGIIADSGTPAGPAAPAARTSARAAAPAAQAAAIADNETPQAEVVIEGTDAQGSIIEDAAAPLAAPAGSWALINLICAVLAAIGAAAALFRRKEDEENASEDDNRDRNMMIAKITGAAAALASVIAFILTEDMTLSMVLTDKWTLLMAALFAVQIASAAGSKKAAESREEEMDGELAAEM